MGAYVIHEDLPQRVGQVLLRPDDVGHVHGGVIDGDTEVVDWQPVAPQDDEVAQSVGVPPNLRVVSITAA